MKFKAQQQGSQMPEPNLVPMMDVILTVLTFFIIVSMTLTSFQAVDVPLPSTDKGINKEKPVEPIIVGMNRQGQVLMNNTTVTDTQLAQLIVTYLQKNPKGTVVLKADKQVTYDKVVQVLGTLRDIGGDRVSLAIE
ncbi:ExbD/TolR family protein [Stenomitos frigidus]|uniref:Biopolymer transporter ExbD n=1 Tax=Stenomitos frigidus ULC18 TaxID=2107698 RepID=A0A2T1DWH0_9CYAN|nr:biopolymer transporter ExbD [Stenomitos frigidus]PSB24837.1 biopolymer transporter ExbD [Stenomitos frigidus ULC18]